MRAKLVVALLLSVTLTACKKSPAPDTSALSGDSTHSVRPDTSTLENRTRALMAADSILSDSAGRARIAELQFVANNIGDTATAASALLRMGWLKLRLNAVDQARSDFQLVLQNYTGTQWADDAAWGLMVIRNDSNCKRATVCETDLATRPLSEFLERCPRSKYAAEAVARAGSQLAGVFTEDSAKGRFQYDLSVPTSFHDPDSVRRLIARFADAAHKAPAPDAARAFMVVAGLWERLRKPDAARALYEQLLKEPGPLSPGLIGARIGQLPQAASFMAALLRNDGVVVPFALFADGEWSAALAGSAEEQADPEPPAAWMARYRGGPTRWHYSPADSALKVITTTGTTRVENHCGSNWGLASDYVGKTLEPGEHHENLAVVMDIPQRLIAPVPLSDATPESRALRNLLLPVFEAREADAIAQSDSAGIGPRLPAQPERKNVALTLGAARLQAARNQTLYLFAASKEYPSGDASCNYVSASLGWVARDRRGGLSVLSSELVLDSCDRKGISSVRPIGTLLVGDRTFIIAVEHGWEDESYLISELRADGIHHVLLVNGGGC